MLYKWSHLVCILFRLTFFTQHTTSEMHRLHDSIAHPFLLLSSVVPSQLINPSACSMVPGCFHCSVIVYRSAKTFLYRCARELQWSLLCGTNPGVGMLGQVYIWKLMRNCQIDFQSVYTILHPLQQRMRLPFASILTSTWYFQAFFF